MNKMTMLYREGMAELRAENEQLNQRIAELEAAQRWIPVSERLPEGRTVLVFKKEGSISIDTTYIDGGNYFWWKSGQSKVTHWMPLPEPPEVNNERDKAMSVLWEYEMRWEGQLALWLLVLSPIWSLAIREIVFINFNKTKKGERDEQNDDVIS